MSQKYRRLDGYPPLPKARDVYVYMCATKKNLSKKGGLPSLYYSLPYTNRTVKAETLAISSYPSTK
jgi:hypothetical protein